jgi:hypothetical protein
MSGNKVMPITGRLRRRPECFAKRRAVVDNGRVGSENREVVGKAAATLKDGSTLLRDDHLAGVIHITGEGDKWRWHGNDTRRIGAEERIVNSIALFCEMRQAAQAPDRAIFTEHLDRKRLDRQHPVLVVIGAFDRRPEGVGNSLSTLSIGQHVHRDRTLAEDRARSGDDPELGERAAVVQAVPTERALD